MTRRPIPWALTVFGLLLVLSLLGRLWVLQQLSQATLGCRWCVAPGVLSADLPLLALAGALFTLSLVIPHRGWSIPWRGAAILILIAYALDAIVTAHFATRLSLADLAVYLEKPGLVSGQLGALPWWQTLLGVSAAVLMVVIAWPGRSYRVMPGTATRIMLAWVFMALIGWAIPAPDYVHDWAIRNVFSTHLDSGLTTPYAEATRDRLTDQGYPSRVCRAGNGTRENIVMLILESWSPYHSDLWTGLNDWTPALDDLARDAIRFERFHAGGFNTNDGLISLLTGRSFALPMTAPSQTEPFEGAWKLDMTLPRQLAEHDYQSYFITSGNLSFSRKGEWLQQIGFDQLEGHDHPAYDGIPRKHFDAVPDDVLYERATTAIQALEKRSGPYFAVIESVSSHHPFIHPYTNARDEAAVIRFMDQSASTFIASLKRGDFFSNGILVVVSDHRAMTFISSAETKRFGRAAASRIPAFIMTGDTSGRGVDTLLHQADLPTTLLNRVADQVCPTPWQRSMLASMTHSSDAPRCVLHARGDHRDQIDAFCDDGSGTVRVDGDNSRFLHSDGLSGSRRRALLNRIAAQRLNTNQIGGSAPNL